MNPTLMFALVIALEGVALITVVVAICLLIWGDFSDPDTRRRAKVPRTTATERATRTTTSAPSAPKNTTLSSAAVTSASPSKVSMTKTATDINSSPR